MRKKRIRIEMPFFKRKAVTNRCHKDELFRFIFQNKEDLLDLYNAVNHSSYTDSGALEINTLDNAIYLKMKNDLSFVLDTTLNLYEHQSLSDFWDNDCYPSRLSILANSEKVIKITV